MLRGFSLASDNCAFSVSIQRSWNFRFVASHEELITGISLFLLGEVWDHKFFRSFVLHMYVLVHSDALLKVHNAMSSQIPLEA